MSPESPPRDRESRESHDVDEDRAASGVIEIVASFGGDRPERPFLAVDLDLIYGSGKLGRRVAPDFYVTGGVRRLAIDYDITLGDLPHF